jgi:hypothetical protein
MSQIIVVSGIFGWLGLGEDEKTQTHKDTQRAGVRVKVSQENHIDMDYIYSCGR